MNTYAKVATAAVAVIAIGAVGIAVLRPTTSPAAGAQGATSSPESSPPATSAPPSTSPAPPLTLTFTSTLHGVSLSYPEGWTAQAATETWTGPFAASFGDASSDFIYDPALTDHLFLSVASQPIGDSSPDEWVAEQLGSEEGCAATEPITIDGASGLIGADDCNVAAVTAGDRGYYIWFYTSGDEAWLADTYDRAWLEEVLATIQLEPGDAVDVAPSAMP